MDPKHSAILEELMANMMSPDAEKRKNANAEIEKYFGQNLVGITNALIQVSCNSETVNTRLMAHLCLRKFLFISNETNYKKLDENTRNNMKKSLLQLFQKEPDSTVRRNMLSVLIECGEKELKNNGWQELPQFLERAASDTNPVLRSDAITALSDLAMRTPLGKQNSMFMKKIIFNALNDSVLENRVKALSCLNLICDDFDKYEKSSIEIMNAMVKLLDDLFAGKKEDELVEFLESFIELSTINSSLLQNCFENIIPKIGSIAMARNLGENLRILAMESLVTIAEEDSGIFRSLPAFVDVSFKSALSLMIEFEENENWVDILSEEQEPENELSSEGEMAIDRLSLAFGSEKTINVAIPLIIGFLKDKNWKKQTVALIAISQIAEAIDNSHTENFVKLVTESMKSQNMRVQYAAIHCIGQMSEDFSPDLQENFHGVILPMLINIFHHSNIVKIEAHAAAALVNFVEYVSSDTIGKYLEPLFNAVYNKLTTGHRVVQEQAVTITSSVAPNISSKYFFMLEKFIPDLMKGYTYIKAKEDVLLKCKCLEALTFIGSQIDKAKFKDIAIQIMQISIQEHEQFKSMSEDYVDFVLQAWIRLSKILKSDFAPFLKDVMPRLFEAAKDDVEFDPNGVASRLILSNSDDYSDEDYNPARAGINEQESALCAFSSLPKDLGLEYLIYVDGTIKLVDDMLDYWGEDNIRTYAALSYPSLFYVIIEAVKANQCDKQRALQFMSEFNNKLIVAFAEESDYSVKKCMLNSVIKILQTNKEFTLVHLLDNTNNQFLFKTVFDIVKISQAKVDAIEKKAKGTENDFEMISRYKLARESETEIAYTAVGIIGTVLKIMGKQAEPAFNPFIQDIMASLKNSNVSEFTKKALLMVVVDVISYIPDCVKNYQEPLINLFIHLTESPDIDVKQTSIYGLGILAQKFTPIFQKNAAKVLEISSNHYKALFDKKEERALQLRDNCVATYGRVTLSCIPPVEVPRHFITWLSMLPLVSDEEEIMYTSNVILGVLRSENKNLMGQNLEYLPIMVNVLSINAKTVALEEQQKLTLSAFVAKLKTLPETAKSALGAKLTPLAKEMVASF